MDSGLQRVQEEWYYAVVALLLVDDLQPVVKSLGEGSTVEVQVSWYDRTGTELARKLVGKTGASKHYAVPSLLRRL